MQTSSVEAGLELLTTRSRIGWTDLDDFSPRDAAGTVLSRGLKNSSLILVHGNGHIRAKGVKSTFMMYSARN